MGKNRYLNPISCVYKIIFKNYIYIGSTAIFSKRKFEHLWKLRNNTHPNPILQNIYKKYGENEIEFSIIEEVSVEKLILIEQKYIDLYKTDKEFKLINILLIAGSSVGFKQNQQTCDRKSKSMMGKNKGKKRSEKYCLSQSIRQKDRIITEEWKNNISKGLKGRPSPNKPKKFIMYKNNKYTYREFSEIKNCNISCLYTTTKEYTGKKYGCKLI